MANAATPLNSSIRAGLLSIAFLCGSCSVESSNSAVISTSDAQTGDTTDTDSNSQHDSDKNTDLDGDTRSDEDTVSGTDTHDPEGPIITASGENAKNGETKEMAFDGDEATKWLTFENTGWIQYDFAGDASKVVSGYSITSANDFPGRDPRDWHLQASDDGDDWTDLDERKNECFSSRHERRLYRVDNSRAYKMYRLKVSAIRDPSEEKLQIAEIELLEDGSGGIEPGAEGSCFDAWKFVIVGDSQGGDSGVNKDVWAHLVYAIIAEGADLVLFTGDLTGSGSQEELEQWIEIAQPLYDANIGVYPIRGEHDSSEAAWNAVFSGPYLLPQNGPKEQKNLTYSGTHKNVFFAGIDNYADRKEVHQPWLDAELKENTQPHVFVFGHEPAFAAYSSDTLDDHARERDDFWESLKNAGARAYFCGHDHFYDHARINDNDKDPSNDLHQFIVGTAGAALFDFDGNYDGNNSHYTPVQKHFAAGYGYILVEIAGANAKLTFKELKDNSYWAADSFSYSVE